MYLRSDCPLQVSYVGSDKRDYFLSFCSTSWLFWSVCYAVYIVWSFSLKLFGLYGVIMIFWRIFIMILCCIFIQLLVLFIVQNPQNFGETASQKCRLLLLDPSTSKLPLAHFLFAYECKRKLLFKLCSVDFFCVVSSSLFSSFI